MKRIILFLTSMMFAAMLSLNAQDARQRTAQTIVQDVLAIVPVQTADQLNSEIESVALAAPESVVLLSQMLKNASEGVNSRAEYVLDALAGFASAPANKAYRDKVKEGFRTAADLCDDSYNKDFLLARLRLVSYDEAVIPESDIPQYEVRTAPVVKKGKFKKLTPEQKCDVIYWIGECRDSSQIDLVLSCIGDKGELGNDAMVAASKIGGQKAVDALLDRAVEGDALAYEALNCVQADIVPSVIARLSDVNSHDNLVLLDIIGNRRVNDVAFYVFDCLKSSDSDVVAAARRNLCGVVSAEDAGTVASLLDAETDANAVSALAAAYAACMAQNNDPATSIFATIALSSHPERFYNALALTGTDEAAAYLAEKAKEERTPEILDAVATIDNFGIAPTLLDCSSENPYLLCRYAELAGRYDEDWLHYQDYHNALVKAGEVNAPADVVNTLLDYMSWSPCKESFLELAGYMDRPESSRTAAESVRRMAPMIVSTTDYSIIESVLEKAKVQYRAWKDEGNADAGYAIDEIDKLLGESKPYVTVLSDEEKKQGFVLLFDGQDMSKWEGDLEGYRPLNGTLYVDSNFGGNIYTKKEYRDFVFRFEFCFLVPAVNNGVGIRTPEGVDAAYHGMCEVQILDHDDPVYSWLNPYQVHGSVYGVIPAKRIVHKPLGEWSTEEIVVKGENIKVTVNGEVILDGNVREACQGHNVAPDGSDVNPFTVDHNNHPGLFNKKGHVSFCGHGRGLKLRNIRICETKK